MKSEVIPPVRVRYAPSPTGLPHVGNIRTALFNWLFARHYGGKFIVRIEDTDQSRKVEGALESILDSLCWLGLDWDEGPEVGGDYGPYFQSERKGKYHQAAQQLVDEGYAYPCYCSTQRLEDMRAEQTRRGQSPGYDRRCRNLNDGDRAQFEAQDIVPVVRLKTPPKGKTSFQDLIRGGVVFENSTLDDFVLLKSDGYPTYHLANVVDDHLMQISHVLRAEEWLSSTPKHVLLYQALGYEPPQFAHLPMILGPDRSKLSKRHGATSVTEFRDEGYLPQAMLNFMALLGWSLDDKTEIFSRDELIKHFSIERVSKTAAIFDRQKLHWMNGLYIRNIEEEILLTYFMPVLERYLPNPAKDSLSPDYVHDILPLVRERINLLDEKAVDYVSFFFLDELDYTQTDLYKVMGESTVLGMLEQVKPGERHIGPVVYRAGEAVIALKKTLKQLQILEDFEASSIEDVLRSLTQTLSIKPKVFFGLLRIACTGRPASPGLFETMTVLGKERCLKRIEVAISKLESV